MAKQRRQHTLEFKREAVRLVREQDMTYAAAAADLDAIACNAGVAREVHAPLSCHYRRLYLDSFRSLWRLKPTIRAAHRAQATWRSR